MQFTHVAYGGCWKCLHPWHRCSASTPRLAASQNGRERSFGTGIGRVTLLQSLTSAHLHELLQAAQPRGRRLLAVAVAPVGEGDLADVDVAARVDGQPMGRVELAQL